MMRSASVSTFVCCFLLFVTDAALGQFAPPPGGWDYAYEANDGEDAAGTGGFTALDGTWSHDNGSDQWGGDGFGEGPPGGVEIIDGSFLRLQDTGNPTNYGFPDPGSNRKQYLGHNISLDGATDSVLDDGATINFRIRVPTDDPLDELHPDGGGGTMPYPDDGDGYGLHNGSKGSIGIRQSTGGLFSVSLVNDADGGTFEPALLMNSGHMLELDITEWHEFWITIEATGLGTHDVLVYMDDDLEPFGPFEVTLDSGDDFGGMNYIAIGLGATPFSGALDVDFFRFAAEVIEPSGVVDASCPGDARAEAVGGDVRLTWTNGAVAPASVDILRNDTPIATGAPADPPEFTDTAPPIGMHTYELRFNVDNQDCDALQTAANLCPRDVTATSADEGIELNWTNGGTYAGIQVSRNGDALAEIAGDLETFTDTDPPAGENTYAVQPTTGDCAPVEAPPIQFFPPPVEGGDFGGVEMAWDYCLDPGLDEAPEDFLQHNPTNNAAGDLDGEWSTGNGSDSWDGTEPGDPDGAPGGVGLVEVGDVGAYLIEDTGDPRGLGFADPSNRKIYFCLDLGRSMDDANVVSLLEDGITLRARFRLTPPDDSVDFTGAPDGTANGFGGKGMFSLVHDSGRTLVGVNQRVGFSLDVDPADPERGILNIGEGANALNIPVPDPTEWLDLWVTAEGTDGDPVTPEIDLTLYMNGASEPVARFENFVPNDGGTEGDVDGVIPGNALYMGFPSTADSGSMEVDLVCVAAGVTPPSAGPERPLFHRGDADGDGTLNITDAVFILGFLFSGGQTPGCSEAADADDGGTINITDGVFLLSFLFSGGDAPPPPGSPELPCGPDPEGSPDIGCESYSGC